MRSIVPVIVVSLLVALVPVAIASHTGEVLGSKVQTSDVAFPPVTYGPGHILPDSPLYSLDKLYQKFRLALVFTPENRAQLHTAIAGERLAELRVMSARNNQVGIDNALIELQHESTDAANDLRDAAVQGKDVKQLARTIHQALADYRTVLVTVKDQLPDSAYEQKLATASDVLWEAKLVAEDALPGEDIDSELAANIDQQLDEAVLGISSSAARLEKKLSIYEKIASKAAERDAKKQQIELEKQALKDKQKDIKAQREKAIKEYLAKVELLRKQREQELAQLKQTIKELQEQLRQLRQSDNQSTSSGTTKITPKITPVKL